MTDTDKSHHRIRALSSGWSSGSLAAHMLWSHTRPYLNHFKLMRVCFSLEKNIFLKKKGKEITRRGKKLERR